MSSSISQGLVLATAMVVSSTVLFLTFSSKKLSENHNSQLPQKQILRSCLYSEEKKRERKKKKVQFAENVKEPRGNSEEYRKSSRVGRSCKNEIRGNGGIPGNRIALYSGILKDRVQRMECSC